MEKKTTRRAVRKIARNRRDHHNSVVKIVVGIMAVVLVLNLILPSRDFSANENRSLAQRPSLSLSSLKDGSFFTDFGSYYADQFLLRDLWMSIKFHADFLMNQREFSGVFVGKDGYLLADPEKPDKNAVSKTVTAMNAFAEEFSDREMNMILVPDAATILGENLPANAPVRDQLSDIRAFQMDLADTIRTIDAASALKSHATERIYYRTDHHWTSEGAYAVFRAAADSLKLDADDVRFKAHTVSESFQGTLASKSGDHHRHDQITIYEPQGTDALYVVNYPDLQTRSRSMFVSAQLEEKDQYTVFFGGNHPLVEIQTTVDNGRSLLIFKDSYANSFIQFLTPFYQTIIMVDPRYYYDDVSIVMRDYGVTDVLYLYSADTLLVDTSLADVLNAAVEARKAAEEA